MSNGEKKEQTTVDHSEDPVIVLWTIIWKVPFSVAITAAILYYFQLL
jgi:hypothetical protein